MQKKHMMTDNSLPFVSAMIVMRNEQAYIAQCLQSLLRQDYPSHRYEVLIIDGQSDDDSLQIARETLAAHYADSGMTQPRVRFFDNPGRLLASGWNLGIRASEGGLVVRLDAHAMAEPDFISTAVAVMRAHPEATCVGGPVSSQALSQDGELIAMALSSPFGVGNSRFRIDGKAGPVDTVAFGLYKREIFDKVGFFDESLRRNQDNDMHARIREADGVFWYDPGIKSTYYTRGTIKGMMKQAYGNGRWHAVLMKRRPQALSLRHLVPFVFVCALIVLLVLATFWPLAGYALLAMLLAHAGLGLFFALRKTVLPMAIKLYGIFLLLHLSYGAGTLFGLISPALQEGK